MRPGKKDEVFFEGVAIGQVVLAHRFQERGIAAGRQVGAEDVPAGDAAAEIEGSIHPDGALAACGRPDAFKIGPFAPLDPAAEGFGQVAVVDGFAHIGHDLAGDGVVAFEHPGDGAGVAVDRAAIGNIETIPVQGKEFFQDDGVGRLAENSAVVIENLSTHLQQGNLDGELVPIHPVAAGVFRGAGRLDIALGDSGRLQAEALGKVGELGLVQKVVLVGSAGRGRDAEVAFKAALGEVRNRVGIHASE